MTTSARKAADKPKAEPKQSDRLTNDQRRAFKAAMGDAIRALDLAALGDRYDALAGVKPDLLDEYRQAQLRYIDPQDEK